ncbi:PREDICTED: uncharacterized protein LOC104817217 [Tarenaya hassleriana]|uniref:uncharacterized protein LOC104817217 n=1 Tax=Tarenaya hassleriana TaxID=28532 RepID=UPI00053C9970|nr:PREDICTED: uncharacterized protein LOC104817217 [Tarenaya hassleriana]XP_010544613.1 PREDICTED: uncharacterized protein LOC104817217 [Tarenaya hassleriana]XP_010544614.1 PREDICTED: uncharacterized protein LOC104817217 [Tarenaya hassleriana]
MNGECPKTTIPIKRPSKEDLLTAEKYGKGYQDNTLHHEYAIVYTEEGRYNGARVGLSVWKPRVQEEEFSVSQIRVWSGVRGSNLNTLEVGWQVYKGKYKDDNPRLFTHWTRDLCKDTGCYNLDCPGFIQTNSAFALGASIQPVSTYGGSQYGMRLLIAKDPRTGD